MDLSAFYNQFRDETSENIRVLNNGLLAIEELAPDTAEHRTQIDTIFRAMHTIKGSARLLGFESIGRLAHTCEHILGAVREGRRVLDRELANDLLRGGDAILDLANAAVEGREPQLDASELTRTLGRGERFTLPEAAGPLQDSAVVPPPASQPEPPSPVITQARKTARQTIRVRVDRLDRLLNLAGELAVGRQIQTNHVQTLHDIGQIIAQQEQALLSLERELKVLRFSRAQREVLDKYLNIALNTGDRASQLMHAHTEQFTQYTNQHNLLIADLEEEVMSARLLPISTAFTYLPRAVRELAHETNKEIELVLEGETTELDRKIVEMLTDPLVHLVRNAVDHGIELPDAREQLGKPRHGTIRISAHASGAFAQVRVQDDGRGMDPVQLRAAAVRKNMYTAELAAALTDQEAFELIFMPGFSTAQLITDISGRGVGMDVVRTNIAELGGQVQVESQPEQGTAIILSLPLTLMTTRVLLVEVGEHIFALPASGCQGSTWAYPDRVQTVEGRSMLTHNGKLASLLRLADLLDVSSAQTEAPLHRMPAVIIGTQRPLAVLVDRLLDEREVVVKPLGPLFEKQRRFNGAIQLGDGRLILLINPATLVQTARGITLTAPLNKDTEQRKQAHLLVADDSFTTRELIRSILHSAGYNVTTAIDGFDALDKLRSEPYDLVVSDVEMPRVDGFQLTTTIRTELGLTDLPVIIVTSLASEAHRRRGLEVGAQAYIVKSQFNQHGLLKTIEQLLN